MVSWHGFTVQAIIFATGQGTTLRPLTETIPKCLLDIGGSTILAHPIHNCATTGLTSIPVVTCFEHEKVDAHVDALQPKLPKDLESVRKRVEKRVWCLAKGLDSPLNKLQDHENRLTGAEAPVGRHAGRTTTAAKEEP